MTSRRTRPGRLGAGLVAVLLAVALTAAAAPAATLPPTRDPVVPAARATACPEPGAARAPTGPAEKAVTAQEGSGAGPRIDLVTYPRPDTPGKPWSQWGQGLVLDDGRFLSAIGNHLGKEGNSFLYVFDPADSTLAQFADVRSAAGDALDWGYGKVHGQIVPGPCGDAYVATYWGTRTGLTYTDRYRGDLLFRIDPDALRLGSAAVPAPGRGIPSLAATPDGALVYGEGVDPVASAAVGRDSGEFFVFDPARGETVFRSDAAGHNGFRNVLVNGRGDAYVAAAGGRLLRYPRGGDELVDAGVRLPGGGILRASTAPAPDGAVYGVTSNPDRFFALRSDGSIDDLGAAPGYTTSLAIDPSGARVYFVPGAHGTGAESGTPLMVLDTRTAEQSEVARLDALTQQTLGLRAGGTYNLAMDPDGSRLYVGLNAGADADEPWGEVVLAIVHLGEKSASNPPVGGKADPADGKSSKTGGTSSKPGGKSSKPGGKKSGGSNRNGSAANDTAGAGSGTSTSGAGTAGECRTGAAAVRYAAATDGVAGPLRLDDATAALGVDAPLRGMRAHAIATGDVDDDGWTDVFVGTFGDRPAAEYRQRGASGPVPDRLLLGGPEGFTEDPTFEAELGRTSGAAFADLDGDGDLDLVVARNVRSTAPTGRAPTTVYRNDDGRLVRASTLPEPAGARSVGVLDYDGDGRLDLFVAEDRFSGGASVLLRNTGDLTFVAATAAAGIPVDVVGMGVATGDLDLDGDPDLFVSGGNRLFLNDGAGRFREATGAVARWATFGTEDDPAGVALGDLNGDGRPDLVVGQHYNSTLDAGRSVPVRLYLNEADGRGGVRLRDVTDAAGLVGLPTKSPHVELADLDADGRMDVVTTAAGGDGTEPIVFLHRGVEDGVPRFEPSSAPGPRQYWVTGAAFDADHDGRLDLLMAEWEPALASRLFRGTGSTGHWLAVSGAPGTTVEVRPAGAADDATPIARAAVGTATGYSAGPAPTAWLGLGDATRVDVRIAPAGVAAADAVVLRNVRADRHLACSLTP